MTCHPFLSGRPARVRALETLVERMTALPGLWLTTAEEVARHVRALGLRPRALPEPETSPNPAASPPEVR
ncbi:MAG: hypothetical protein ACRDYU_14805 [Actinomycetes bacterium]